MSKFTAHRTALLVLTLAVGLAAAPAAWGGGLREPDHGFGLSGPGLLAQTWAWLTSLWAPHGGCIDPNGKPVPCSPTSLDSDRGGCIDPNGQPAPCSPTALAANLGGCIDPNGQPVPCSPAPLDSDLGGCIDPDGRLVPCSP